MSGLSEGARELNPDYYDMLSAFAAEDIRYLLVEAYALAAHERARATGDIDLWVDNSRTNAERVMKALSVFGAPLQNVEARDFESDDIVFQIGVEPRRIDILTAIDAVDFEVAWAERQKAEVAGLMVPVISRRLPFQNKQSTGRLKDLADARWLETGNDG